MSPPESHCISSPLLSTNVISEVFNRMLNSIFPGLQLFIYFDGIFITDRACDVEFKHRNVLTEIVKVNLQKTFLIMSLFVNCDFKGFLHVDVEQAAEVTVTVTFTLTHSKTML